MATSIATRAFMPSHLDYYNALSMGLPVKRIWKLSSDVECNYMSSKSLTRVTSLLCGLHLVICLRWVAIEIE